jgi:hypothetical protein
MLAKTPMHTQIAHRAIELLKKHGWCQDQPVTNDGRMCMVHATHKAALNIMDAPRTVRSDSELERCRLARAFHADFTRRLQRLIAPIKFAGDEIPIGPVTWNDTKGRTVDEVIQLLERVAAEP